MALLDRFCRLKALVYYTHKNPNVIANAVAVDVPPIEIYRAGQRFVRSTGSILQKEAGPQQPTGGSLLRSNSAVERINSAGQVAALRHPDAGCHFDSMKLRNLMHCSAEAAAT